MASALERLREIQTPYDRLMDNFLAMDEYSSDERRLTLGDGARISATEDRLQRLCFNFDTSRRDPQLSPDISAIELRASKAGIESLSVRTLSYSLAGIEVRKASPITLLPQNFENVDERKIIEEHIAGWMNKVMHERLLSSPIDLIVPSLSSRRRRIL